MNNIEENATYNKKYESNARCSYCQAELTAENEHLPRIDYRETEILNLKQQLQNLQSVMDSLKQELSEKDKKL